MPCQTTSVSLGKPRDDTVVSLLYSKSIVVEMPATPSTTGAHHNINKAYMWPLHRSVHSDLVGT